MPAYAKTLLGVVVLVCAFADLFRNDTVYRTTGPRLWVLGAELFIGLALTYCGWCGIVPGSPLAVLATIITSGCCLALGSVIGTLESDDDDDKDK